MGVNNLARNDQTQIDARILRVVKHPGYRPDAVYNDIALIQFTNPVKLSYKVKPACLPSIAPIIGGNASLLASGWGATAYQGSRSDDLLKAHITTYDQAECKAAYGRKFLQLKQGLKDDMFCLLDPNRKKDTCQGNLLLQNSINDSKN